MAAKSSNSCPKIQTTYKSDELSKTNIIHFVCSKDVKIVIQYIITKAYEAYSSTFDNIHYVTEEDDDMTNINGLLEINQDPTGWLDVSLSRVHDVHWLGVELQV